MILLLFLFFGPFLVVGPLKKTVNAPKKETPKISCQLDYKYKRY